MRDKLFELLKNAETKVAEILSRPLTLDESLGIYADYLIDNNVIVLPCKIGDTVYKIRKFCEKNTGYKEFYRPSKEFEEDCTYLSPQSWYDDCDVCRAVEDFGDGTYCSLNTEIYCDTCKERFAIQKDKFNLSMLNNVFNTNMFNNDTNLEDTYFLTEKEAEHELKVRCSKR